jgi:hypothetical protein
MRDYGKVAPQFWTGTTGRALRGNPDAQLLALYLMTGPASSMTGIFYLPLTTIVFETGIPAGRARTAFKRLAAEQAAQYDEDAALVFVPNMARFQIGEKLNPRDNRIAGILRELAPFRAHAYVRAFWRTYEGPFSLGPYPWEGLARPLEGASKPLGSQDQDQEQEQEQEISSELAGPASAPVMFFPVVGKTSEWGLQSALVAELEAAFPALDVRGECLKAKGWASLNPRNRKTAGGMPKFLFAWMARVQNSNGARPSLSLFAKRAPDPDYVDLSKT